MKKSCDNCKGKIETHNSAGCCEFGFKTRVKIVPSQIFGPYDKLVPLEDCPKPLTYKEYLKIREKFLEDYASRTTKSN